MSNSLTASGLYTTIGEAISSDVLQVIERDLALDFEGAELSESAVESIVKATLDALSEVVVEELGNGASVTIPFIATLSLKYKAPQPKHVGVNPWTGEENFTFKAKPASFTVAAKPERFVKQNVPSIRSAIGKKIAASLQRSKRSRTRRAA